MSVNFCFSSQDAPPTQKSHSQRYRVFIFFLGKQPRLFSGSNVMADEVSTRNSQKLPARPKWSPRSLNTISLWALSEMEIKREVSSKPHHNSVMWNLSVPTKLTLFLCLCKVLLQFTQFPLFFPLNFPFAAMSCFSPFHFLPHLSSQSHCNCSFY